jgi:hypothetical protein
MKANHRKRLLLIIVLLVLCFIFASGAVWILAGGCASA